MSTLQTSRHALVRAARSSALALAAVSVLPAAAHALAINFYVTNTSDSGDGSLRQAILDANGLSSDMTANIIIQAAGTLSLTNPLPAITNTHTLTITGQTATSGAPTFTIDGNNAYRAFFIYSTDTATQTARGSVAISNLTIQNTLATGGNGGLGGQGGGGGAGLGGAVFVGMGNVSLSNVALNHNAAVGGNGGTAISPFSASGGTFYTGAGGGGGLGGVGGSGASSTFSAGCGGGGGVAGSFPDQTAAGGSIGGNGTGGALTGFPSAGSGSPGDTSSPGPNAGGGAASAAFSGGGGGIATSSLSNGAIYNGGFGGFGGGGGGGLSSGGNGGYGGGSGGGQDYSGNAGFGGGAGGGQVEQTIAGNPGFGGGAGGVDPLPEIAAGGGGGLGAGGALFVRAGNSLTLTDVTFSNNSVTGGTGGSGTSGMSGTYGSAGSAIGSAIFLGNNTSLSVSAGKTITIAESLGGGNDPDANGALTKTGPGTLVLSNTANSYHGGTIVAGGSLIALNAAVGTGSVNVTGGTLGGNGVFGVPVSLAGVGAILDPGSAPQALDNFYFSAGLTAAAQSTFHFDILNNYDSDFDSVTGGALTLTGPITIDVTSSDLASLAVGDAYTLLDYQGAASNNVTPADFTLSPNSLPGTLSLTNGLLQFTLTAVPEPGTTFALAGAAAVMLRRRRR